MLPSRLVVVAVALAFAVSVNAQTSASLTGSVTMLREGTPLAGVTITVSSPALQGTRSTVTGESGTYDFTALPPGEYRIVFVRDGLITISSRAELRLSQTARVDAAMFPPCTEEIVVTAPPAPASRAPAREAQ